MRVNAIAAISRKDRGLGFKNDLLWKIPADLKRFKELTLGHPVIMGRKNYESIGRLLPGRPNIIVTRDESYKLDGAIIAHSLEEAFSYSRELENSEAFVIGGGEIYKQALPFTNRLYLTVIDGEKEADVFFPEYEHEFTKVISKEKGEHEGISYEFVTLERVS